MIEGVHEKPHKIQVGVSFKIKASTHFVSKYLNVWRIEGYIAIPSI